MKKTDPIEESIKEAVPDKSQLHPPGAVEEQYKAMVKDLMFYWGEEADSLDTEKVETVSCSLCAAPPPPASTAIFVKFRFPYLRCPQCSLVYPSPRPKMEHVEAQYKSGRFSGSFTDIYLPSAEYRMKTIFRERVEEIISPRIPKGRILDIGASSGHFLKVAHDHGFDVHGIEPNPDMVSFATDKLGLPNIKCGTLEEGEYPSDFFDAITVWDVLEHVPDPGELLRNVFRILKPGGWVFAYTENLDSFNVFVTGGDSEMFVPDVHLRHYSPATFKKEFEEANFLVRDVLTKGLDIQHIETILKLNPGKYPEEELRYMMKDSEQWQAVTNALGKGDNLRLFAQKP